MTKSDLWEIERSQTSSLAMSYGSVKDYLTVTEAGVKRGTTLQPILALIKRTLLWNIGFG